jgi:hypothetical protein
MTASQRCQFSVQAFLIAVLIVTGLADAGACSCEVTCKKASDCIQQAYANSSVVFVGTPVEVTFQKGDDKSGPYSFSTANYRVRLRVKESFKGMTASEVVSNNGLGGGADCSYGKMEVGRDYLVYATLDEKRREITPTPCSRTRQMNPAESVTALPEQKPATVEREQLIENAQEKNPPGTLRVSYWRNIPWVLKKSRRLAG